MDSEAAEIARAQAGDRDAFRTLLERHSRGVHRLAWRMTGNQQDAEDVVQEAFFRAWKQIKRFDGRSSFATWVFRIASNYSLDLIRARRPAESSEAAQWVAAGEPGPDRLAFSGQVGNRVASAMEELSAQERTAFVLRHFEGMSIEQIGAVLELAPSATKNSIFRAVQKLRRALEPMVSAAR
jgi:RNA polymerase sigma-70 factor, ECF subfamily